MTLYILYVFADGHKMRRESDVIGYFTSKASLRKAIKAHADELNIYDERAFYNALACGDWWNVNTYATTGAVEVVAANKF